MDCARIVSGWRVSRRCGPHRSMNRPIDPRAPMKRPWYRVLYLQVWIAMELLKQHQVRRGCGLGAGVAGQADREGDSSQFRWALWQVAHDVLSCLNAVSAAAGARGDLASAERRA